MLQPYKSEAEGLDEVIPNAKRGVMQRRKIKCTHDRGPPGKGHCQASRVDYDGGPASFH
jgi:hypothetical protein